MRRCLIAFLTLVVAVQLSWAAMATCCLNEIMADAPSSAAVQLSDADHSAAGLGAEADAPCEVGHCHCHHACLAFAPELGLNLGGDLRAPPRTGPPQVDASHIPDGLDRPNWLRA
jgi:hypothetical protein